MKNNEMKEFIRREMKEAAVEATKAKKATTISKPRFRLKLRIFEIFREIRNYYYVKGIIRKHKNTPEWKKHNLSVGYFGVIYTVINLPPEVFESEEQYYSVYVMEKMMPVNNYLAGLNLQEVVTPRVENLVDKEGGVFAFGVKYIPLFRELTWGYVLSRLSFIGIGIWLQMKFGVFGLAVEYIKKFIEWAF